MSEQRSQLEQEFLDLWRSSAAKLQALCLTWTGRPDLAEEALARSRVLALEKYPQHAHRLRHPGAWMRRLTYNVCIDLHRELSRRREDSLDEMEDTFGSLPFPAGGDDPETAYLCRERHRMLRRAIGQLPERLRRPLELHVFQGFEYREIADALCITEANVRKRMQHGREALEKCFGAYHQRHQPIPPSRPAPAKKSQPPPPARRVRAIVVVPVSPTSAGADAQRGHVLQVWRRRAVRPSARRRASLEQYIEDHPGGWKRRLDLARLELREGRLGAAWEQYRRVVDKQPRRWDLWREMAATLAALGAREEAMEALAEARRRSRTGADRQRLRAAMLDLGGDVGGALEVLREAREAQPEEELLAATSARLELAGGNPGRALSCLETLLSRFPEDAEYLLWHHDALHSLGRWSEAGRALEQALQAHRDHPPALVRWLARRQGGEATGEDESRWHRRRARLEKLAPGWLEVAWLEARGGDAAGWERFDAWRRAHPGLPEGRLCRLHLLLEQGRWQEAGRLAATMPGPSPGERPADPRWMVLPVLALEAAGRPEAPSRARRLGEALGESGEVLALAAVVLVRRGQADAGDLELAAQLADKALTADPDGVRPRLAAARVALARQRPRHALELLEPLEALPFGDSAEAVAACALESAARRDRRGAEAAWPRMLAALRRRDPWAARPWAGKGPSAVLGLPTAAWLLPPPWAHRIVEI